MNRRVVRPSCILARCLIRVIGNPDSVNNDREASRYWMTSQFGQNKICWGMYYFEGRDGCRVGQSMKSYFLALFHSNVEVLDLSRIARLHQNS